jgi:hypothetical protein
MEVNEEIPPSAALLLAKIVSRTTISKRIIPKNKAPFSSPAVLLPKQDNRYHHVNNA